MREDYQAPAIVESKTIQALLMPTVLRSFETKGVDELTDD